MSETYFWVVWQSLSEFWEPLKKMEKERLKNNELQPMGSNYIQRVNCKLGFLMWKSHPPQVARGRGKFRQEQRPPLPLFSCSSYLCLYAPGNSLLQRRDFWKFCLCSAKAPDTEKPQRHSAGKRGQWTQGTKSLLMGSAVADLQYNWNPLNWKS